MEALKLQERHGAARNEEEEVKMLLEAVKSERFDGVTVRTCTRTRDTKPVVKDSLTQSSGSGASQPGLSVVLMDSII